MSILLDHCVPHRYLRLLKAWGYPVSLLREHTRPDAPDLDVIRLAKRLEAVLLAVDSDFANAIDYPPQDYPGIVILCYKPEQEEAVTATLEAALRDLYRDGLRGALVIVTPRRYRIRRSG